MADETPASERTEKPSPKKLREAREKGQVPRSRDLSVAAASLAHLSQLFILELENERANWWIGGGLRAVAITCAIGSFLCFCVGFSKAGSIFS